MENSDHNILNRIPIFLLMILFVLVSSCNSAKKSSIISEEDKVLNEFLSALKIEIEQHDWKAVTKRADPVHYNTKVFDVGLSKAQYIAELLGLHAVNNNINQDETTELNYEDLNRIKEIIITSTQKNAKLVTVRGVVILKDGHKLNLHIELTEFAGSYLLTGAVG